jgi:hypothetical protein
LVRTENLVRIELVMESRHACGDDRADLPLNLLAGLVKSNSRLEAENAAVRQQLIGLQRKLRGRGRFSKGDRPFYVQLYRWFPSIPKALLIIRPETLVR